MRRSKSETDTSEDREMNDAEGTSVDPFEMLKTDHRKGQELFTRFEDADEHGRSSIAEETLTALEIHTKLEEELVYPLVAKHVGAEDEERRLDTGAGDGVG